MSVSRRLTKIYENSKKIIFDQNSKIVLMSDCHRGIGNGADNFAKNQNLYYVAMQHYERGQFTYIELGDGDELWKNKHLTDIVCEYPHIFELLSKLYQQGRMYVIYGNHDMVKKSKRWVQQNLYARLDDNENLLIPLFPGLQPLEGIVLEQRSGRGDILLIHGHQADFFNYSLWRLSKFLVRYVWQPLELIGVHDPFSASKNYNRRLSVEGKLSEWARRENKMLIAGHTHRQVFPKIGEPLYFNDGCSVHPRHITAIEIENGSISLVKWTITAKPSGVLFVSREIMRGPVELSAFLDQDQSEESSISLPPVL